MAGGHNVLRAIDPRRAPGSIDRSRLAVALQAANLPTLLMVLVHLTGDARWLRSPYRPTRPRGLDPHDSGGFPESVAEQIRGAALEAVVAWAEGAQVALPEPGPRLLQRMLSTSMGEKVPEEYQSLMREEMGLTAHAHRNGRVRDRDAMSVLIIGAGISGLVAAVRLREAEIPFRILERMADVGGVGSATNIRGLGSTRLATCIHSRSSRATGRRISDGETR